MTGKRPRLLDVAARALLAASGLCCGVLAAGGAPGPAEFGVRSMVADASGSPNHGRIYAILSVQMMSSDPRNLPTVDEDSLIAQVCRALDAHGFQQAIKGQNPELLITVHYGRAWLRNPYLNSTGDSQAIEGFSTLPSVRQPTQDITGTPTRFMDETSRTYEARVQKASLEKLYIRVTGWQYPSNPKSKAVMLWKTTALLDDPDSWNLNAVAGAMLTASSPYFDQQIAEKELEIRRPVPEGHVKVGPTHVLEPNATKSVPATAVPPPAAIERAATVARKKFNLPAGDAVTTLQAFSRQSGEEIIFPVEQIRGIRTNGVQGEMSARAALDRLLDGTGLSAVQDEKTEALAVRPTSRR